MKRTSKYGNVKTEVDNITFASKREADLYINLKALEKAGLIRGLELQVRFPLHAVDKYGNKLAVSTYVADFVVQWAATGETVIYDAKGVKTQTYMIKKKWFNHQYHMKIEEV